MIANSGEYYTHRNNRYDVVTNQAIRFTEKDLPTAPEGVYVVRGVKGVGYGDYAVSVKGSKYPIRGVTGKAEEFIINGEIPANEEYGTAMKTTPRRKLPAKNCENT